MQTTNNISWSSVQCRSFFLIYLRNYFYIWQVCRSFWFFIEYSMWERNYQLSAKKEKRKTIVKNLSIFLMNKLVFVPTSANIIYLGSWVIPIGSAVEASKGRNLTLPKIWWGIITFWATSRPKLIRISISGPPGNRVTFRCLTHE